jgi:hypothetical protein
MQLPNLKKFQHKWEAWKVRKEQDGTSEGYILVVSLDN